ncbi:50S ribosomal protein L2 [Candidatus Woesearchaeota archaeon]|nr:50S ribosomal protein L2 [Candidatus Woesearchaeota archaeon]
MGKNLIQQKRGKGSTTYRAPSFRYLGKVKYPAITEETIVGKIMDLVLCPGHSAPLAQIKFENGEKTIMLAPEGIKVGDDVKFGPGASVKKGNVLQLKDVPEGTSVYNIESSPGDGGKFVRGSGTFAKIVGKIGNKVVIRLPSNKQKLFREDCRASIGIIAGGGRLDKPFLKAGKRYHTMKARNKLYPKVSGVSMNAVDHPFGGSSSHHKGKPLQSSRNAPPGRKVGKIAPRRTGRTKR